MSADCCLHHIIQSKIGFQILTRMLVAPATNIFPEPFPWLVLNRSHNTCLALQFIRAVVCSTAFFIKVYFQKIFIEIPLKCLFWKLLTLLFLLLLSLLLLYILYIIQPKKRKNHVFVWKCKYYFFITFTILSKFQELSCWKVK